GWIGLGPLDTATNDAVQKARAPVPPMAEQLGVGGGGEAGPHAGLFLGALGLLNAHRDEVSRALVESLPGVVRVVGLLLIERHAAGDAVELQPHVLASARALLVVLVEQPLVSVVAEVAIELAIAEVAGIALAGAPDLFAA